MMNKNVILYSNDCPNCKMLKSLLDKENIEYEENNSIDDMFRLGIDTVPVLGIDEELYSFKEAKKIIKNLNGGICK